MSNLYLQRYAYQEKHIDVPPPQNLGIVVTIPCFNEPDLITSLRSLDSCEDPGCAVEVIIVVNEPEDCPKAISATNQQTISDFEEWLRNKKINPRVSYYIIYKNRLPRKHAGVGLARKIAMDEAVRRFEEVNNKWGIIACFDADSQCDKNYLSALRVFFNNTTKPIGCSIYFEHPLAGALDYKNYEAIVEYEIFLRYYVNGLRFAGYPHAYHTIGSSMAISSEIYQKQGGMNRRKAGEDFYFLHKIIPHGTFGDVSDTCIIPSARKSDRVPFGTGKAVADWLVNGELSTYDPQVFDDLAVFLDTVPALYNHSINLNSYYDQLPPSVKGFLLTQNFTQVLARLRSHATNSSSFIKSFYMWMDGFRVLKYVHFARDNFYPNMHVIRAASQLLYSLEKCRYTEPEEILQALRTLDRNS